MLIKRHLRKHSQPLYNPPYILSPGTRSGLASTYFMKSILNSKGNFYCTLCSNIKISKRTSSFINFLLRLVSQLLCDIPKTNFWMSAYWFSQTLPGNACSNSKCICPESKRKKITFNSQRAWHWCRPVNTWLFCTKIIRDLKKFSGARILLVTLSNQLNSKSTKTLC